MKQPVWRFGLAIAVFSAAVVANASAPLVENRATVIGSSKGMSSGELQTKGRYKRQGDECVWDANDDGPNQCTPVTEGRFKQDGDKCYWDASDRGPNQCTPKKGRFKKEGDKCVWNGEDSGPNQCNPRQPRG